MYLFLNSYLIAYRNYKNPHKEACYSSCSLMHYLVCEFLHSVLCSIWGNVCDCKRCAGGPQTNPKMAYPALHLSASDSSSHKHIHVCFSVMVQTLTSI